MKHRKSCILKLYRHVTRKQLNDVMDDFRSITAKRELETKDAGSRIEKLTSDHSKLKEESALLANREENLKSKVKDLSSRLKTAEDKLKMFEDRALSIQLSSSKKGNDDTGNMDLVLAQTKVDLEKAQQQLQLFQEQVEQYKSISQSSEERLLELNATYDIYKIEMDKKLIGLNKQIELLESQCASLNNDLAVSMKDISVTSEALEATRAELESEKRNSANHRKMVDDTEANANRLLESLKNDLELHANISRKAQESYEREVMAHSGALQQISKLKQTMSQLKIEKDEAELKSHSSISTLESTRSHFEEMVSKLQEENQELQNRIRDLVSQNALIHSQFEQIALSSRMTSSSEAEEGVPLTDKSLQDLGEVIKYLRREKEIIETKLQITINDLERSNTKVEHLQTSLDEANALLAEERSHENKSIDAQKHAELLDRIEQANLLRESNVTLRSQLDQAKKNLTVSEKNLKTRETEIGPLKEQILILQGEIQARKAEYDAIVEDNMRWKARSQQILEKYERIDPVEHAKLKQDVTNLTQEIEKLQEQLVSAKASIDEHEAKLIRVNNVGLKYKKDSGERAKQIEEKNAIIAEKEKEILKLSEQNKSAASKELEALKEEKAKLLAEKSTITTKFNSQVAKYKQKVEEYEAQIASDKSKYEAAQGSLLAAERQKMLAQHQLELKNLNILAQQAEKTSSLKLQSLQQKLIKYKQELVHLKTSKEVLIEASTKISKEAVKNSNDEITELEAAAVEKEHEDAISAGKRSRESPEPSPSARIQLLSPKRLRIEAEPFVPSFLSEKLTENTAADEIPFVEDNIEQDPQESVEELNELEDEQNDLEEENEEDNPVGQNEWDKTNNEETEE
jgi:nucleoprotein TPR